MTGNPTRAQAIETAKRKRGRPKKFQETTAGQKAKEIAQNAGVAFIAAGKEVAGVLNTLPSATSAVKNTVSQVANTTTTAVSQIKQAETDVKQLLSSLTASGYQGTYASREVTTTSDAYGGLQLPDADFTSFVPPNLLQPEGLPFVTEEEYTKGLAQYAGANRAMGLYQAGFQYITNLGNAKLAMHKAQGTVVRATTESVKAQQNIVKFDIENVNLAAEKEKLNQADESYKQEQLKTTAARNETEQIRQKLEALEGKRDAEIKRINATTNNIIQKYLKDSISGVA